jgi:hypothetical protein
MNHTINFCRTFDGCVPCLHRLSFDRSCIFSIMSSSLPNPLKHFTTHVTPACDNAIHFLTLFVIAFLWLLMNVAIVCAVDVSTNYLICAWNSHISNGRALSFILFSFLASILSFVFLVVSCCSAVLPWYFLFTLFP